MGTILGGLDQKRAKHGQIDGELGGIWAPANMPHTEADPKWGGLGRTRAEFDRIFAPDSIKSGRLRPNLGRRRPNTHLPSLITSTKITQMWGEVDKT